LDNTVKLGNLRHQLPTMNYELPFLSFPPSHLSPHPLFVSGYIIPTIFIYYHPFFWPWNLLQPSIAEVSRPVSLGPAALQEWATQKLVGASPPQAEPNRPT
ncbi:MAG: hypothetical protein ACYS71_08355, partial [Planctomycetota bacterium]